MSLRSATIRLAASLPKGREKRALLRVLTGASKHVTLDGIIKGYQEGEDRELNMIGPFVSAAKWLGTMKAALAWTEGAYNEFSVARAGALLNKLEKAFPGFTFAAGREYSPVIYIAGNRADLIAAWPMVKRSGADEVDISASATSSGPFYGPKAPNIPEQGFIRLWWD